jgi:hypothetical protein
VRIARLVLGAVILLFACDRNDTQAPPLDPPRLDASPGGACSETEVDGATAIRFEAEGSCLRGDVMVLFRCSPEAVPILRISSVAGPSLFLGGSFAVPVRTLPAHVRFAGAAHRIEVLIADPPPAGLSPTLSTSASPSVEGTEPTDEPEPEPLVYMRSDGVTERWLRLEGRRGLHDPPVVWVIGDSILHGGRDAVEAGLSDWSLTLDAEVGRSTSSGVALAEEAVAQDADAVVVELGTNDFSPVAFRGYLIQTLDILASVPLVIWQTARGPEGDESIRAVNEAIREIVPTYPNLAIADWEAFVPEEAVQVDGIHPDEGFEHLESELLVPMLAEWRNAVSAEGATSCARKVVRETS